MSNQRIKTPAVTAPRCKAEAEKLLEVIGAAQREVTRIEADFNDRLAGLKTDAERQAEPYNRAIEGSFAALHAWAEAHRDELCPRGVKTARLASGEISWRQRPPSVRVTGTEKVIERLRGFGLAAFIRTREEIDKEAILADPERVSAVKGLTVVTGVEDFVAKPYESEIERAEPVLRSAA